MYQAEIVGEFYVKKILDKGVRLEYISGVRK